jgi:hypothetical protein
MGVLLNCKKATKLLMEAEERSLTPVEKVALEFHMVRCLCCRNFRGQRKFLKTALDQYAKTGPERK